MAAAGMDTSNSRPGSERLLARRFRRSDPIVALFLYSWMTIIPADLTGTTGFE
jgi:hypothetical protein